MGSLAGIPIGMGSYTIGVMIRITGSMRFQDQSSYTPLEEPIQQSCWWIPAQGSGGIWKLEASWSVPEVQKCTGAGGTGIRIIAGWNFTGIISYVACFCIGWKGRLSSLGFQLRERSFCFLSNRRQSLWSETGIRFSIPVVSTYWFLLQLIGDISRYGY
jgi:hypothetical protein